MASTEKKRKSGGSTFKPEWELSYFFISDNGAVKCLVCGFVTYVVKKHSLERHYKRKHMVLDSLLGFSRQEKIHKLKEELVLSTSIEEVEIVGPCLRASYIISLRIAKAAKPFSEGEFVKQCLVDAAEILCPSEVQQFKNVKLSHQTVSRRIHEMGEDVQRQLTDRCKQFLTYSLAVDETTDISDTSQLTIFVRGVDAHLNVTEELLDLVALKDTTTGADIFRAVEDALEEVGLPWDRLCSVTTDGAPSMCGVHIGFVTLVKTKMLEFGEELISGVHCIIHQEALCAKAANIGNVVNDVIRIVNFLRAHGLNHRQFKELLIDINAECSDIPYHCAVRWLSRGAVFKRFFALKETIQLFLDLKDKSDESKLLADPKWVASVGFLADITCHMNALNISMQGKNCLITDLFDKIKAFELKLYLWEGQLKNRNVAHFSCLQTVQEGACFDEFVTVIQNLKENFSKRFKNFREQEQLFTLFATPFSISAETVPEHLQLELIDLQCHTRQKDNFRTANSLLEYYVNFPQQEFPKLHMQAAKVISMFGSTYVCESFFSLLQLTKSKFRGCLSDESLRNSLRLMATRNFVPDIERIVNNKQNK